MLYLVVTVIAFIVGFVAGCSYLTYTLRQAILERAEELGMDIDLDEHKRQEELKKLPPRCEIETHNDQLYLYNKDTSTFYGQAKTLEELATVLYNNHKIDIAHVSSNADKMWFVKGKISETVLTNES